MIKLRPVREQDKSFLYHLFVVSCDSRSLPADDAMDGDGFLYKQFVSREKYYRKYYPHCELFVVLRHGREIGRLYIVRGKNTYELIDLTILPDCRDQGVGSYLIQGLAREAFQTNKEIVVRLDKGNRAWHLFQRLGFNQSDDCGVVCELTWRPSGSGSVEQDVTASDWSQLSMNKSMNSAMLEAQ